MEEKLARGEEVQYRIMAVSDTHGQVAAVQTYYPQIEGVDLLIHAGDHFNDAILLQNALGIQHVEYVRGNCDIDWTVPSEILLSCGEKTVFLTHGHEYGVKYGLDELRDAALKRGADICIFGHTHRFTCAYFDGKLFLNPGSPCYTRGGENSMAVIDIDREGNVHPRKIRVEF